VQFAPNVIDGQRRALKLRVFIFEILVGHQQFKQPSVKLWQHHNLHSVARVPLGKHLKVSQRSLPN